MKITRLIIAMGIVLFFSQSFAQDPTKRTDLTFNDGPKAGDAAHQNELSSGAIGSDYSIGGTSGTPYLNQEWIEGVIIMKDNSVITGNKFRYNIYTQQMQFTNNLDTMAIANPEEIKLVRFADKEFIYANFYQKDELKQGYFELLKEGECSVLKRWIVSYHLVEGETHQRMDISGDKQEFIRECNCFLKFGNNPARELENRKKDFIACFEEDSQSISAFMKQGKLKYKNQDDLLEIVDYYNVLY